MSDAALEWQATSRPGNKAQISIYGVFRTPIPQRKDMSSGYGAFSAEIYANVAYAKGTRVHPTTLTRSISQAETPRPEEKATKYPRYLVTSFVAGLAFVLIGAVSLLMAVFSKHAALNVAGAVLLALGSLTVVMTLLRGQDLDEQTR
jgi:hypothetical protein